MERGTTIVAIAVAGAIAVGMVSCATRCVADRARDAEAPAIEAPATEEEVPVTRWRIPEPDGTADGLRTRAWEAADGSGATLSVRGGTLVERSAAGDVAVTAFQVTDESEGTVAVRCVGPEGATFEGELRIGLDDGAATVSSGAFRLAGTYREREAPGTVRIEGEVVLADNEDATTEETNVDFEGAALKVKSGSNLTITGTGTLTADGTACKNAIKGGEGCTITIQPGVTINAQAANMGKSMMYIMPAMSVFFCWQYDATFSIYWILSNLIATAINVIINKKLPDIIERDKRKREAKLIKESN